MEEGLTETVVEEIPVTEETSVVEGYKSTEPEQPVDCEEELK